MTGNSLLRLLTLKVDIWRKISIEISPPIEVDYGNWLGPVLVWRGKYAISVYKDIRLWDCDELYASVNKASPHANAHYRTQKAYVFRCATAQGPFIWGINDEGQLDRFEAESGHNRNVPLIHSVTSLTSFTLEGRLVLATAVNGNRIKRQLMISAEISGLIDQHATLWGVSRSTVIELAMREFDAKHRKQEADSVAEKSFADIQELVRLESDHSIKFPKAIQALSRIAMEDEVRRFGNHDELVRILLNDACIDAVRINPWSF